MSVDANIENVDVEETTKVERSEKFEVVERHYKRNTWPKSQVADAVGVWITEDEYFDIVGEKYVAPEKVPTDSEQMLSEAKEMQMIMMEAMADQYEERQEKDLNTMEVLATIYEETLAVSGKM